MAINTQKFLPSQKSSALPNISQKTIKNIGIIKVKVIQIEKILKGTIALEKKSLDEKKRKESGTRREKQEEKLETKPNVEKGNIKMPSAPKLGILDWVKNFIGNIILGYFAVRLIDHLPKIMPIVKFLGAAADFIIDIGGKLLNGLVTFIDWGYKAYDATRGFIKNLGGENFAKGFDKFTGLIDTALFLTTVLAGSMALEAMNNRDDSRSPSGDLRRKPTPGTQGRPKVTTTGGGGAGKPDIRNPLRQKPKVTTGGGGKLKLPKGLKPKGGLLGLVFLIPDLIESGMLVSQGRGKDGIRTLISAVSGVAAGMAAYAAVLAGVAALGISVVGIPAAIALAVAGFAASYLAGEVAYKLTEAGLRKMGLVDNDPKTGKPYTYKGGGITRGGKTQGTVKRTIKKPKRTIRTLPSKVKPGQSIGGEKKIKNIFPEVKSGDKGKKINPYGYMKSSYEKLSSAEAFGGLFALPLKAQLGEEPSKLDYQNAASGLNSWMQKTFNSEIMRTGGVGFAEGGSVNAGMFSNGEDITKVIEKSLEDSISSKVTDSINDLKKQLGLKPDEKDGKKGDEKSDGGDATGDDLDSSDGVNMGTSFENGLAKLLKDYEGLRTAAYLDAVGIPTIGMGATYYPSGFRLSGKVQMGQTITEDEALMIKIKHIKEHRDRLLKEIPSAEYLKVPDNVKAALESKVFNYGSLGTPLADLVKGGIKSGNYQSVADYFRNTLAKHDGGLNSWRRNDEAGLIETGTSQRAKVSFPKSSGGQATAEYAEKGGKSSEGSLPGGVSSKQLVTGPSQYIGGSTAYHIDTKFHKSLGMGNMISAMDKLSDAYSSQGRKIEFSNAGVSGEVYDSKAPPKAKQSLLQRAIAAHSHSQFMRAEGFLPFDYYNPKKNENRFGKSVEGSKVILPSFGGKIEVGTKYGGYGKSAEIYSGNKMVAMTGHGDTRYEEGGETEPYAHTATLGEKGKETVIDADSTKGLASLAPNFLKKLNTAETKPQLMKILQSYMGGNTQIAATYGGASAERQQKIDAFMKTVPSGNQFGRRFDQFGRELEPNTGKLKQASNKLSSPQIASYASYEQSYPSEVFIPILIPVPTGGGGNSSGSSGGTIIAMGGGSNPFDSLYKGG